LKGDGKLPYKDLSHMGLRAPGNSDWVAEAACRDIGDERYAVFFPNDEKPEHISRAMAYCATCCVRLECLDYAINNRIDHGIWGGTTAQERRRILRNRAVTRTQLAVTALTDTEMITGQEDIGQEAAS
jgi:WhiB family redox-sensing transcriptional regulator